MPRAQGKDISEIFGYSPDDLTTVCRKYWREEICPFVFTNCSKFNHDQSIVYGVCSVSDGDAGEVIICPKRLYANNYQTLREVAYDAFGNLPFYLVKDIIGNMETMPEEFVLALGQNSGKEIQVGTTGSKLSMDWVLVRVVNKKALEIAGVEVQSIDITNNYRDNWQAYKNHERGKESKVIVPNSLHGLNWANVHKRLIPQIIRKGQIYSDSELATKGIYFIVPNQVYSRFENILGDITPVEIAGNGILSVFTYSLGPNVEHGSIRSIQRNRIIRVSLVEFANNFIKRDIPGTSLDNAVNSSVDLLLKNSRNLSK